MWGIRREGQRQKSMSRFSQAAQDVTGLNHTEQACSLDAQWAPAIQLFSTSFPTDFVVREGLQSTGD